MPPGCSVTCPACGGCWPDPNWLTSRYRAARPAPARRDWTWLLSTGYRRSRSLAGGEHTEPTLQPIAGRRYIMGQSQVDRDVWRPRIPRSAMELWWLGCDGVWSTQIFFGVWFVRRGCRPWTLFILALAPGTGDCQCFMHVPLYFFG